MPATCTPADDAVDFEARYRPMTSDHDPIYELGPCGRAGDHLEDDPGDDFDFDDWDAVERHALRKATVAWTLEAITDRLERSQRPDATSRLEAAEAVTLLTWTSNLLEEGARRRLARAVESAGGESRSDRADASLALWRAGALDRDGLRRAGRELLDAGRLGLATDVADDAPDGVGSGTVIEGPWRRGAPPLERTHQLHVTLLALRHGGLRRNGLDSEGIDEVDEVDEQILELWHEELRAELNARLREIPRLCEIPSAAAAPDAGDDSFAESAHLVAAISELWRDTAPAARPLRLPLEKLTRLLWQSARRRRVGRAECAALLVAAGNQRLDDLPSRLLEARLYVEDEDRAVLRLTATWAGGRRPAWTAPTDAGDDLHLGVEALVIRALSGPARTGPRRG